MYYFHENFSYVSPDDCLRLSFDLKDSLVNIFEPCKHSLGLNKFHEAYWTKDTEIFIRGFKSYSEIEDKLFMTRVKYLSFVEKEEDQNENTIELKSERHYSTLTIDSVYYFKKNTAYIGQKLYAKSYVEFQKEKLKNIYLSSLLVYFEGKRHQRKVKVKKAFNVNKKNLLVELSSYTTIIRIEKSKVNLYNWSFENKKFIKQYEMKYQCKESIYKLN